jgi:hypothetical protein
MVIWFDINELSLVLLNNHNAIYADKIISI